MRKQRILMAIVITVVNTWFLYPLMGPMLTTITVVIAIGGICQMME